MKLVSLKLNNYRNFIRLNWQPGDRFNVLVGDNGQGKTNLLEALAYLSTLKSFRKAASEDIVQDGCVQAELYAEVKEEWLDVLAIRHVSVCRPGEGRRKVEVNGKRPPSSRVFQSGMPIVIFHPETPAMMVSADLRRHWLDDVLAKIDGVHAANVHDYEHALRSRNRLLKQGASRASIEAFNPILIQLSELIRKARIYLIESLEPLTQSALDTIMGDAVRLNLRYRFAHDDRTMSEAMMSSFEHDRQRGYTTVGCHHDDLETRLVERKTKHYISQGQARSVVLSLKLAELDLVGSSLGRQPIFLLDDVSSELDAKRTQRFFHLLSEKRCQVFLTTTRHEWIALDEHRKDWKIKNGSISAIG